MSLLTRDEFRAKVFERDKSLCIMCGKTAQDAHHIVERRLWGNGGYHLANGASLCETCHWHAEATVISCADLRSKAGIKIAMLPEHLSTDQEYDKWGNPIMPNGTRLKGELFYDENVQKILKEGNVLHLFINRVKFPRTYHLPWSPGLTSDDKKMYEYDPFKGKSVVATVKMDGENTTLYNDGLHARSLIYEPHESRNYIKMLHARIAKDIPDGWRVCGENLYAKHSIHYTDLKAHFQVFSIWNARNECFSWEETLDYASLLGLETVDVIYEGPGDRELLQSLHREGTEGYVVRNKFGFSYSQYKNEVGKFVRANHVTTDKHWKSQKVEPNLLRTNEAK